uniref:Aminoacyl-tRNA hydrolase n=1 Tax=Panagrolaimus sp. PS1159 TaxID=55785 RepID=A0AC35G2Y9_9BILA
MGGFISLFWPTNTPSIKEPDYNSVENEVIGGDMGASVSTVTRQSGRTHKMVFVANMELGMGKGKLAAQVGHACLGVYRFAMNSSEGKAAINSWTRRGEVKIVVKGNTTQHLSELYKKAKKLQLYAYLVQDAGYTQIPAGSRTVLGVFGPVEDVDQVTGDLKLL